MKMLLNMVSHFIDISLKTCFFLGECPLNLFIIIKGNIIALEKYLYQELQPRIKHPLISESPSYFDLTQKKVNVLSPTKISIKEAERDSLEEFKKNQPKKREYQPLKFRLLSLKSTLSNSSSKLFNDQPIYLPSNSKNDIILNSLSSYAYREDNENLNVNFEKEIQRLYPKMRIKYNLSVGHCLGDLNFRNHKGR